MLALSDDGWTGNIFSGLVSQAGLEFAGEASVLLQKMSHLWHSGNQKLLLPLGHCPRCPAVLLCLCPIQSLYELDPAHGLQVADPWARLSTSPLPATMLYRKCISLSQEPSP